MNFSAAELERTRADYIPLPGEARKRVFSIKIKRQKTNVI